MLLREKDSTFIQDTRIEGNLSVVVHPGNPDYYGDGSVEVGGILRTDGIMSATPNTVVHLGSPLNLLVKDTVPQLPIPGQTQIYSSSEAGGRLVMVNSEGTVIDLNPLTKMGDLMTFDGLKNTTVRFGSGLPGQQLVLDPWINYSTGGLAWKSNPANVHSIGGPSDTYVKYLELTNVSSVNLTNTPARIAFTDVLRHDASAFSVGTSDFLILQNGMYEMTCSITVGFKDEIPEDETPPGNVGCAQMYVETSDPGGFSILPGSRVYTTIPYHNRNRDLQTMTCRVLLNATAGTRVRIYANEYDTITGKLEILPELSTISVRKMIIGSTQLDTSEYFAVHGLDGARPTLTTINTAMPTNTLIFKTNVDDILSINSIKVEIGGKRYVFAKLTFTGTNVPEDAWAHIEASLTLNNSTLSSSISTCQIVGNGTYTSVNISAIINTTADDIIGYQARILAENISSGAINVISEECALYAELIQPVDVWKKAVGNTDSSQQIGINRFSAIGLVGDLSATDPQEFTIDNADGSITCRNGGTIQYVFHTSVENVDTEAYTAIVRSVADLGIGYREVPGSISYSTVYPGVSQDVLKTGTMFLPANAKIKFECLAPGGGDLILRDDATTFLISKIEDTNVSYIGQSDFGKFWKYVADEELVYTTSTTFSLRMAAVTVELPEGKYRLGTSFEWDMTDAGVLFETQIVLDDNTVLENYSTIPVLTGSFQKLTSFREVTLGSGSHSIALKTRVADPSRALLTRSVRIELFKI